ncbi:MAG: CHAD domain-containing protein [Minwuia sp.]|nr:CHAD domain-containing protein [Minwuia sp.]
MREIEIKLTGRSQTLDSAFRSLGNALAKTTKVASVYFDTVDHRLWHLGLTLRLRARDNRHELTMKRETGTLARGEWSALIDEPVPDPGALPRGAPRAEFGLILPEELSEWHRTEVRRQKKVVSIGDATFEISLDRGRIVSGNRSLPVEELEIELLGGPEDAVARVARSIVMQRNVQVTVESKAARGVALAAGTSPAWRKFSRPALMPSDTVASAFATILKATAHQVAGNLAASRDGSNPKGVHQLRVGLRRLRSALSLFRDHLGPAAEGLKDDARTALQALGPARDLDVFLTEMLPPVMRAHPDSEPLQQLCTIAENARRAAYVEVRRTLSGRPFNRMLLDLLGAQDPARLLADSREDALPPVAARLLRKGHRKLIRTGQDFANLPLEQRHEVRIAAKKLRYAVDFMGGLFPGDAARTYRKGMSRLQDDLGRLNDAAVTSALADQLAGDDAQAMVGAAIVKGWYAHRLAATEPEMIAAWQAFSETPVFWRPTAGRPKQKEKRQ